MIVKIDGLKELDAALRNIPAQLERKYLRQAVGAMGKVVRDAVREQAPIRTGLLRREIVHVRSKRGAKKGQETFYVMVRQKTKKYANNSVNRRRGRVGKSYKAEGDAYYWRYLEFGTATIRPQPFLRRGFESSKTKAVQALQDRLRKSLDLLARENKIK